MKRYIFYIGTSNKSAEATKEYMEEVAKTIREQFEPTKKEKLIFIALPGSSSIQTVTFL